MLSYFVLLVNNAELTNAVKPVNNVFSATKPLKAACNEPEAATRRRFNAAGYRIHFQQA